MEITIKNFSNYTVSPDGTVRNNHGEIMKVGSNGQYPQVYLVNDEGKMQKYTLHRLLAEHFITNPNPNEFDVVNHKNGNKEDYSLANLEWTNQVSNRAHAKLFGDFSSKYIGVSKFKNREKWVARIKDGKNYLYLGSFDSEYEAHLVYKAKSEELNKINMYL